MGRRNNSTLALERVRRTCKKLGISPADEALDRERHELLLRFDTPAPAVRLRSTLIAAKISAVTVITPVSTAVVVHLDAYEEQQPYKHTSEPDNGRDVDEAA